MIISIPIKLAERENFNFDNSCNEPSIVHVNTLETIGTEFIIVTERGSYFSHIIDINKSFVSLLHQIIPGEHRYVKMTNASVCAKLNTVAKKAKLIIERIADEEDTINLQKITEQLNNIPWKFLGYKAPNEIKNS